MNCFALFDVVLRVVVLLESVTIWKSCAKKRKQSISEDIFSQKICIHNAIKMTSGDGPLFEMAPQQCNFSGCLAFGIVCDRAPRGG